MIRLAEFNSGSLPPCVAGVLKKISRRYSETFRLEVARPSPGRMGANDENEG
jgi:hypothetical protein